MKEFTLEVEPRSTQGKAAANRVRREGFVPGIAYMHGSPSLPITCSTKEFVRLAKLASASQVFTLKSSESRVNGRAALIKEIQQDFVKNKVLHVDFQLLRDDEEVTVDVTLHFVGEAPGVKLDGGILTAAVHAIALKCLPRDIPTSLDVDVSSLRMGQSLHAVDLKLPQGVKLAGESDETIVSVVAVRATVEETTAAATPAEGAAAGDAAAAAAPADGAAAEGAPAGKDAAAGKAAPEKKEKGK